MTAATGGEPVTLPSRISHAGQAGRSVPPDLPHLIHRDITELHPLTAAQPEPRSLLAGAAAFRVRRWNITSNASAASAASPSAHALSVFSGGAQYGSYMFGIGPSLRRRHTGTPPPLPCQPQQPGMRMPPCSDVGEPAGQPRQSPPYGFEMEQVGPVTLWQRQVGVAERRCRCASISIVGYADILPS